MTRQAALDRLRVICLALPEAHEVEAWGEPTFRVRNKLFAMYADAETHHGRGIAGVWVKSTHVNQDLLLRADPARFFLPPYVRLRARTHLARRECATLLLLRDARSVQRW